MPKRSSKPTNTDPDALIRHHIEEASVHLGTLKQLLTDSNDKYGGARTNLTKVGQFLKSLYVRHGGHPDA